MSNSNSVSLTSLVASIAVHLTSLTGEQWLSVEAPSYMSGAVLYRKGNEPVFTSIATPAVDFAILVKHSNSKVGQLYISGLLTGLYIKDAHHNEEVPSINASASKTAEALAKDIHRRLLEGYKETFAKARKQYDDLVERKQKCKVIFDRLQEIAKLNGGKIFDWESHKYRDNPYEGGIDAPREYYKLDYDRPGTPTVRIEINGPDHVSVTLSNLSPEQMLNVVSAVGKSK
jgi:hypothetical protein